jgi:hypothetical protein
MAKEDKQNDSSDDDIQIIMSSKPKTAVVLDYDDNQII